MDEKVKNILAVAMQTSNPDERRAWLERACAGMRSCGVRLNRCWLRMRRPEMCLTIGVTLHQTKSRSRSQSGVVARRDPQRRRREVWKMVLLAMTLMKGI
jgi:hypothetical protein